MLGKKVRQMRRQGLTPGNIFGRHVESAAIQIPTPTLTHILRTTGRNEIVYLRLDGETPRPTLIRHVQRHPINAAILHVDFQQVSLTEKVRLEVPIVLTGTAPAVATMGGTLLHSLDYITVEALPREIPSQVEVDVSGLEGLEVAIHVRDIPVPAGLTVLTNPDLLVATVAPPRVEEAVAVEEAAAEAVAAEEEREQKVEKEEEAEEEEG
jgi:large subunit ribosomal protein L25